MATMHFHKKSSSSSSPPPMLEPLQSPIALRTDFIAPERSIVVVTMHRSLLGGDFTARRAQPPGSTILTSTGKWKSLHPRIEFKDGSGMPLFSWKMPWWSLSTAWSLESSDGGDGGHQQQRIIVSAKKHDVVLHNNAASAAHEPVTLQVRGDDAQLSRPIQVLLQGRPVAVIRKTSDISMSAVTLEFEIEVAAGMDQALVRC